MSERIEEIEAVTHPDARVTPGGSYRLVFRPKRRGYAEALTGLPEPLELVGGVSGVVYMLPVGCRIAPEYRPARSGVRRSGITLWPAPVDPAFDAWIDLYNPSDEPVALDGIKLIASREGANCPTCGALLGAR
jgi:hypothetical protein